MSTERAGRLGVGTIGAGRVGAVLASALAGAGHALTGIAAISDASRERAAVMLPSVPVLPIPEVVERSELVLLSVPDTELAMLVAGLADAGAWQPGQLVLHTAARFGTGVLDPARQAGAIPLAVHPAMNFTGTSIDLARLRGHLVRGHRPGSGAADRPGPGRRDGRRAVRRRRSTTARPTARPSRRPSRSPPRSSTRPATCSPASASAAPAQCSPHSCAAPSRTRCPGTTPDPGSMGPVRSTGPVPNGPWEVARDRGHHGHASRVDDRRVARAARRAARGRGIHRPRSDHGRPARRPPRARRAGLANSPTSSSCRSS